MIDANTLVKQCEKAFNETERSNQSTTWEELSEFILPGQSGNFVGDTTPGEKKMRRVFDLTAIQANQDLAAAIHSTLTNPATKWSSLRFKNETLNNNDEAVKWLDEVNKIIHTQFNESNFDSMVSKNYQSLSGLGTMILFQEEINKASIFERFRFEAVHLAEVAFSENYEGYVDCVYRKHKLTCRQILERWEDKVPDELKREYDQNPEKEHEVIFVVKPRPANEVKLNSKGMAPDNKRPYAGYYILTKGSVMLEEVGYYEFPYFVTRWQTMPSEVYGRGPGHIALGTVRSMNKVDELGLKRLAQMTLPPILTEQNNMISSYSLRPGQQVVVRSIERIRQLTPEGNPSEIQMGREELKNDIKSTFFLDKLFLPPRTETGEMSAFEVEQRLTQMQRVLGPTLSRLNNEFLSPLIIRSYYTLLRGGMFPEQPDVLKQQGFDIEIGFVNQLSRAQKVEELQSLNQWLLQMGQLAQIKPEVLDLIAGDFIVKYSGKTWDVPEGAILSDEQVKAARDQRAEQAQQAQALQAGVAVADIQSKTQPQQ